MTRFDRTQLVAFVRAIDRNLSKRVEVTVIGGAAAAIAWDSGTTTADIDLFSGMSTTLAEAARKARQQTGLAIAVGAAPVADLPYRYEERLRPARGLRLALLDLRFPDKYDLVLSKVIRGYQHDLDAIEGMHHRHRLAMGTLLRRFESEMTHPIGEPSRIRMNVVMAVARLYGTEEGRRLAALWGLPLLAD